MCGRRHQWVLGRLRVDRHSLSCKSHSLGSEGSFPIPKIWIYDEKGESNREDEIVWNEDSTLVDSVSLETWNWCRNFVLGLQLCPWARTSLETTNATQIFVAANDITDIWSKDASNLVDSVSRRFIQFVNEIPELESAAIFFLAFPSQKDFLDFYEWFTELEDNWTLEDDVIIAPFHPDWEFDGPISLNFEKRSPYPTISLVSTRVVEAAGPSVTDKIGIHNEQALLDQSPDELQKLWESSVHEDLPASLKD